MSRNGFWPLKAFVVACSSAYQNEIHLRLTGKKKNDTGAARQGQTQKELHRRCVTVVCNHCTLTDFFYHTARQMVAWTATVLAAITLITKVHCTVELCQCGIECASKLFCARGTSRHSSAERLHVALVPVMNFHKNICETAV